MLGMHSQSIHTSTNTLDNQRLCIILLNQHRNLLMQWRKRLENIFLITNVYSVMDIMLVRIEITNKCLGHKIKEPIKVQKYFS